MIGRFDFFLLWGHGYDLLEILLKDLRKNPNFEILLIKKFHIRSMKKFIHRVYAHDYAPIWHLKSKTKYLKSVDPNVVFVFVWNSNVCLDYFGEGDFRHSESLTIKNFKGDFRKRFNPKTGNRISENHVIHASDNEQQTLDIANFLNLKNLLERMVSRKSLINIPCFIDMPNSFKIHKVKISDLRCNVLTGNNWNDESINCVRIENTPHFQFIENASDEYELYINKHLGGGLIVDHDKEKFLALKASMKKKFNANSINLIIVKKSLDFYIVLDGVHRLSIAAAQGLDEVIVCEI
jgi:hypothetical protein